MALSVALACNANYVMAQDSTDEDDAADLSNITVSGSRLKRENFETAAPVASISAEDIRRSPATTLGDLLNELPQLRSTFGLGNSGRFIGTAGGGFLDLRGLGTDRTLVLINGRRHVSGAEGSSNVDFNSIPTALVERIDVVTGANSAVYGADAVSGVVNVILNDSFNGLQYNGSVGQSEEGGFTRYSSAFTAGRDFANGRGNAVISIGYDSQDELLVGDRDGRFLDFFGFVANPADGDTTDGAGFQVDDGIPDDILVPNQGFFVLTNGGFSFDLLGSINPDGSFNPLNAGAFEFIDGNVCGGVGCTPLDLDTFQQLQVPFERYTVDANLVFEVNENIELYIENRYSNIESSNQGQPSFDFGTPITIFPDNPFISPSVAAAANGNAFDLRRFNVDLGLRFEDNQRQTFRTVLGARGALGSTSWDYDVFANYGRTTTERINFNNRIDENFAAATDAVAVSQADIDAITNGGILPGVAVGNIVCRSRLVSAHNHLIVALSV